jgi:hypothetical protein
MHVYERWIARRYLANALKVKFREREEHHDEHIHEWIRAHRRSLGLPPSKIIAAKKITIEPGPNEKRSGETGA